MIVLIYTVCLQFVHVLALRMNKTLVELLKVLILNILFSLMTDDSVNYSKENLSTKDIFTLYNRWVDTVYADIETLEVHADSIILFVDFIEYYRDDEAVEIDIEITETGDTYYYVLYYYVLNDYIIIDSVEDLLPLLVTDSTRIELLEVMGDAVLDFDQPTQALKRLKLSPFKLAITRDDKIVLLQEIFIP